MNTIYKVIWNDTLRVFQVVNELTRSRGKKTSVSRCSVTDQSYLQGQSEVTGRGEIRKLVLATAVGLTLAAAQSAGFAADFTASGLTLNMGSSVATGNLVLTPADPLPGDGDTVTFVFDESTWVDLTGQLYSQDRVGTFNIDASSLPENWDPSGVDFQFSYNGQVGNEIVIDAGGAANLHYSLDASYSEIFGEGTLNIFRQLTSIELTGENVPGGLYVGGSTTEETEQNDLTVGITGGGDISFGMNTADVGYLTLNGTAANTYTGRTYVGATDDNPGNALYLYFGKNQAFGDTANLFVAGDSKVFFDGVSNGNHYSQTVHGLTGTGELNLGTTATLNLAQNSTAVGDVQGNTIRINNIFKGTEGTLFDVDLSGQVEGYEVVFTNELQGVEGENADADDFSGKIDLSGGYVTAWKEGEDENRILRGASEGNTGSTLLLSTGGQLAVDGSGEVNNLVIANAEGWESNDPNSTWAQHDNAIRFEQLDLGTGKLTVQGDLTLEDNATVAIDDINTTELEQDAANTSILDADDGIFSTIIEVTGDVNDNGHTLALSGEAIDSQTTEIEQPNAEGEDTKVAEAVWDFDDELTLNGKNYEVGYRLTELKLTNVDQNYVLTAEEDGDLSALISGNGGLTVTGGYAVTINGDEPNTYTGSTVVEGQDTTVILAKTDALGETSGLTVSAGAGVEVQSGVSQTVGDLAGEGWVRLDAGSNFELAKNESAEIETDIQGDGIFTVDLGSADNVLQFTGTQSGFTGKLFLTNGTFSLRSVASQDFACDAHIHLNDGANFEWSNGSNIGSLTIDGNNELTADTLVIGDAPSLTVDGNIVLNGNAEATAGVEVADNITLVDFDNLGGYDQSFIDSKPGSVTGTGHIGFTATGATATTGGQTITLGYTQNDDQVANTTWLIADQLQTTGDNSLTSNVLLTGIEILGDLQIVGEAGVQKDLTAEITGHSGSVTFTGGTIAVGAANRNNTYTSTTTVAENTEVILQADSAFGRTSALTASGTVTLAEGVEQWIGDLSGNGTLNLEVGSTLTLEKSGSASLDNVIAGSGTFVVALGATNNALSFTNVDTANPFTGTFALSDLTFTLSQAQNAEIASGAKFVLQSGSVFDADQMGNSIAGLTFDGGELAVGAVDLGSADDAKLTINGDLVVTEQGGTVSASGINLVGAADILQADDGVSQVVAHYTGNLVNDGVLTAGSFGESEIKNETDGTTVAYAQWAASGVLIDEDDKNVNLTTQLTAIELADTTTGLILDGTGGEISAEIRDHDGVAGTISFTGTGYVLSHVNTYTGVTNVSGSVTAGADSAFGTTSNLNITGSGSVDLGNHSQTVGSLNIAENADLVGTGALTIGIAGGASQSQVAGENAFSGAVTLANGHTLTMTDAAGLGTSGIMSISDGSTLILEGDHGDYGRDLEGSGSVVLREGANITLTGSNAGYTGDFSIEENSTLVAAGTTTGGKSTDDLLGDGGNVAIASGSTLVLSQAGSQDWTIDNSLSGSGTVAVTGSGADEEFGFLSTGWGANFDGTLDLTGIRFVVGAGNTVAGNNAANMQSADAKLQSGAVLEVQTGANEVDTFDALTLAGGTIQLDGTFGLNSSTTDQAKLVLDSLTINSESFLNVTMQESGGAVALNGSLSQADLLLGSNQDAFETLLETNSTVQGFDNLHLAGGADSGDAARQAISNGTGTVAYGIYDWELGLSQDQTDVGIGLTLTEVAIEADKTLVLTGADGADTLGVLLSGEDGNLEIASGTVHLTHTANGGNTYGGTTTVREGATLTALAGGLGQSEWLTVEGTYGNLGNNTVGGLTGSTGRELNLFENTLLTLSHADAGTTSTYAGKLTGAGGLAYETGTLTITENAASDWTGQVSVGAQDGGATLVLQGGGALASGSIALLGEESLVQILDDEDVVFANDVTGTGTLQVDLSSSDNSFTFATNQANLATGSGLVLGNVRYELADGDDSYNLTIADKLNITVGSGAILSTDGESTKDVWGLTLSGGELYLGNVDNTAGQIHLDGNGTLTIDAETTISFAENETTSGDRYENGLTGGALLSGGGVFSLDIITGVTGLDGDVRNLRTDETFADSNEDYYQDIVEGGDPELVAKLYRGGDGKFFYDENRDTVYMTYGIRRIDLQWTGDDNGLTLNADGMNNAALDALVTGAGNIVFAGGKILVTGEEVSAGNTYTGATYVRDGAEVTLAINNAFGETKLLQVDGTGSVHLQDGLSQTVGDVAGTGAITLGNGSTLTLDYSGTDGLIEVGNAVSYESTTTNGTSRFVIDGEYAPTAGGTAYAELDFTNQASDLGNVNVELKNVTTSFDSVNDVNYQILGQAAGIMLGENADLGISATSGGASQSYTLNNLVFNGGNLSFANATLSAAGSGTGDYVLDVGTLDVTNGGTLSVSAEIGSAFNILEADDDTYAQTLIHYGSLRGDVSNIGFNAESLDASEIRNADDDVTAYVTWQGVGENGGVVHDADDKTIGLEYEVDELQLALADDEGFVVQAADGASGDDLTLSATITNYRDVAGTITYGGGNILVTGSNDYTGTTNVNAGTITLGNALGFGKTQELNVVDGAGVDIAGYDVTLGALNLEDGSDFSGIAEANITLGGTDYAGTSSSVAGEHGYAGGIALTNGHTLTMTDAAGLGTSGVMSISEDSILIFRGDIDEYGRDLQGGGSVVLQEKANITLTGSNAGFTGDFSIEGNSTLVAAGTTTDGKSADELLGQGGNVAIASGSTLVLSEAVGGDWTIDNSVSGDGTLRVVGTNAGESFGFSSTGWTEAFAGTLDLSNIRFAVGTGSTTAGNNALNMAAADAVLHSGSVLEVETAGQAVDTFQTLTVENGASVEFDGTFALNAQTSEFGQLVVDELTLQAGANIVVGSLEAGQDGNADFGGTIVESSLFASSEGFQTLISQTAGSDIELDGVLLNGQTGTATAEQRITSAAGVEVATGFYRYGLATNGSGATQSLGIGYDLYRVDIDENQVLTLSENQTFDQQFTGSGGLTIASGAEVVLAHSAEGDSTYQGDTTVLSGATLTAQADSISADSKLIVSGTYENVGNNTVDGLDIETNGILDLASGTLTVDHADDAGNSEIDGTVEGSGALAVHDGTLTVNSTETTGYLGNILLGAADSAASMTLSNVAGLGTGTIRFEHADSTVDLTASADTTLTNLVAGAGTLNVTLGGSGQIFQFASGQATATDVFTGTLNLVTGTYDLTNDAGAMANAELATNAGAIVVVNDEDSPVADRELGSLSLDGGVLNFGTMTAGSDDGQIVTDSFSVGEGTTEVVLSLSGVEDTNGSSVFDAGTSLTLIEGYDGTVALDGKLVLSSQSGTLEQSILQNNVHVATFTYGNGQLNSSNGSVEAVWGLTEIALEDETELGLNISAADEEGQSGSISALISGTGNITFSGGTVVVAHDNTYDGTTTVTGGVLQLGSNNALGQASARNDLDVSGGIVDFGGHSQTLGTLTIDEGAGFSANGASITLSAGNSLIAGANDGATGTYVLQNAGTTLELNDALATGSMTVSMGEGTTLVLDGFGTSDAYGTYSNHIDGGEVQIGGGQDEASAYVELTDHTSSFETASVMGDGHLLVNNVEGGLMFESLDIASGGSATLNGTTGWTLDEALTLDDGASLHLSAGGIANTINFSGQTADNIRGSIFFTDSNLMLGGTTGTGGASNADALQNATVHVGEGFLLTVATGDAAQTLDGLTFEGGTVHFDGTLGLNVGSDGLGRLVVTDTLDLTAGGAVTVTGTETAVGTVDQSNLLSLAEDGTFEALITADTIIGDADDVELTVDGASTVTTNIMDGTDGPVAEGTFSYSDEIRDSAYGVNYGLTAVNILSDKTLTLTEDGDFGALISNEDGAQSLTIAGDITLTNERNDYTAETIVTGGHTLTALDGALGHTAKLTVEEGNTYINQGDNEVGGLDVAGTLSLSDNTTLTIDQTGDSTSQISGTLTGTGDLVAMAGELEIDGANEGYSGDVSVGTEQSAAIVAVNNAHSLGSGTVNLVNESSEFSLDAVSGASKTVTLSNTIEGDGVVRIAVSTENASSAEDVSFFSFNQNQGEFTGTIAIDEGGYSLAYATDEEGAPYTANQIAARKAHVELNDGGKLFVSTNENPLNRYIDKDVGSLTLAGGDIYFGGLFYTREASSGGADGGQLQLGRWENSTGALVIDSKSGPTTVHLGDGATNTLSAEGTEVLLADDGAKIDFIQNASSVTVNGTDLSELSEDEANNRLNGSLEFALEVDQSEQRISQNYTDASGQTGTREVAIVNRVFGDGNGNNIFGIETNGDKSDLYLNYSVSDIELIYTEDDGGLVVTGTSEDDTLSARLHGAGNIVFRGTDSSVITLGKTGTTGDDLNSYTGITRVESGTIKFAADNAFGSSDVIVSDGATVDLGSFSQATPNIVAEGDDALAGTGQYTLTEQSGQSSILGHNTNFHGDFEVGGNHALTIGEVDSLGVDIEGHNTNVTLAEDSSELVMSGVSGNFTTDIAGSGTVSFVADNKATADVIINTSDLAGFTGNYAIDAGSMLTLVNNQTDWNFSTEVSGGENGNGTLVFQGTGDFTFANANQSDSFAGGTYVFDGLTVAVGNGNANELNLQKTNGVFDQGSSLVVDEHGATIGGLALDGGRVEFTASYTPGETAYEGSLTSTDFTVGEAGGTVSINVDQGVNPDFGEGNESLTMTDGDIFDEQNVGSQVTLISSTAGTGSITDGEVGNLTLDVLVWDENSQSYVDAEEKSATVSILSGDLGEEVADGTYGFKLVAGNNESSLDLAYGLTNIAIYDGKTLELTGVEGQDNVLSATISDKENGSGSLAVLGGHVELTNADNSYTGSTTIEAGGWLTASAGVLGQTSGLTVETDGIYENAGDNAVGDIEVQGDGELRLTSGTLKVALDADEEGSILGDITGSGNLTVSGGTVSVEGANAGYSGTTSVAANGTITADDIASLGTGTISTGNAETGSGTVEFDLGPSAGGQGYELQNAVEGNGTLRIDLADAGVDSVFNFADGTGDFTGTLELIGADFTLDASTSVNQSVVEQAVIVLGNGSQLNVGSDVRDPTPDFHDRYVAGLALGSGSTVSFGGLVYNPESNNKEYGGQLNLGGGDLDLSLIAEGSTASIHLADGATNYLGDGAELLVADDTAQINLFENVGDIVFREGDSTGDLNDYLALDLDASQNEQTIRQQIEEGGEYVEVANVHREFGDFGSASHDAGDGSVHEDVYVEYTVDELELTYTGDHNGLHVATSAGAQGDDADLKMLITGDGNIVFDGGDIVIGAANDTSDDLVENSYKGATYVNAGSVTLAKNEGFGDTKLLDVENGATVDLGRFNQTVLSLTSDGELRSESGFDTTLTIGVADSGDVMTSYVNGANTEFHADVELLGSGHTLTMNDGAALGDGTVALHDNNLVVDGAGSASGHDVLTAALAGTGDVDVNNAFLTVDRVNTFTGSWTATGHTDLIFNASADDISVSDLLGASGNTVVISDEASVSMDEDHGWTLANNVSGNGHLHISAGGGEFQFADSGEPGADTVEDFTGTYHFTNSTLTLNDITSNLAGDVSFESGATAVVGDGEYSLNDVAVENGGKLEFTGNIAPGHYNEENPSDTNLNAEGHISADSLTLAAGAQVEVDMDGLKIDPDDKPGENVQLTAQDVLSEDESGLLTVLVTTENGVSNNGAELVTGAPSEDSVTVDIVSNEEGVADAKGTYDYALQVSEDGKELGISYKLTEVAIEEKRTLNLSASTDGSTGLRDNTLTATLTGKGSLAVTGGHIVLQNGGNNYEGTTSVLANATLTATEGSLGENGLIVVAGGTYENDGDNTTSYVNVDGNLQLNNETTFTIADEASNADDGSVINGNLQGGGNLVLSSGFLTVSNGNTDYTGDVSVAENATLIAQDVAAVGSGTSVSVEGEYRLDGVAGEVSNEVSNDFTGSGTVSIVGSNVTVTGDNAATESSSGFTGTFSLENGTMTVNDATALGGANVSGVAETDNELVLDFAEDTTLSTVISGTADVVKNGAGDLSLNTYAASGTFTIESGNVDFTSFGADGSDSTLVMSGSGLTASVAKNSFFKDLTIGSNNTFTIGGTNGNASPINVSVAGKTDVGSGTLNVGVNSEDAVAGNVLTTQDFSIDGGQINLNGVLESSGWTIDHIVVNGTGSGNGSIFVTQLGEGAGGVGTDAWLVQAGEGGNLSDLDLTLVNEHGEEDVIDAGSYEWHLLEAENGAGYYLHAFNKGTGDIDGNEIREPAAGAQAALLMASQTAFDLSLHDHIGNTPYVDQLTGEKKLTSLWILQRGDWSEWDDMSGQLSTDGKVMTTTIGGDVKSWVSDAGYQVHLGLLGAYAQADFDVKSDLDNRKAQGEFTGWSVGGYAAFQPAGMDGAFGSLQVRWNRFDNEAGPSGEAMHEYTSDGFSIQGELGYTKTLSSFRTFGGKTGYWRIEPHVRTHWNGVSADTTTDDAGRTFSVKGDGNIAVRVGFRSTLDVTHSVTPTYGDPTVRAYVEANYLRNTKQTSVTMTNEFRTSTVEYDNSDMAEFRFGLEGQFNRHLNLWGDVHHVTGDDAYNSTGVMLGLKYNF